MLSTEVHPLHQFDISSLSEYTNQIELAGILGVNRVTLFRYQLLAKLLIADYREEFTPRIPLTRYQCWVLIRINDAFKIFKNKKFIAKNIHTNSNSFSKYTFTKSTGIK